MTLFSIEPLRAPGEDGLLAIFYQKDWSICGKELIQFVKSCFDRSHILEEVNRTLIVLIPKCPNPSAMTDLRLISLCNTIYKVVTKVIVNKLKPLLPSIINPTQVSFVPGRHIIDNIFILQESMHNLEMSKGRKVLWHGKLIYQRHIIALVGVLFLTS